MKLTPMPKPPYRTKDGVLHEGGYTYDPRMEMFAPGNYHKACVEALRERIAALAKYAEHNANCSRFTHISNPHLKRELAEKFKQALPDCTCGLTNLMDTLRKDGLA